ncbi:hypothetical protein [Georgenia wangjunii]|uniref:hypothetical protein n=1 Tax=Georgenia wangjunii TaxID=3117730 RepID=UPI002F26C435
MATPFPVRRACPGDFNGDRDADLIARTSGGELRLYPGDGRGNFARTAVIGKGWNGFRILG